MTQERFLIGQPVRSLQYMLGELSLENERLPFVAPDGLFGEETLEAVMVFQREFAPPVTGRVDQRTWDAIVERYLALERCRARPMPLSAFPDGDFQVEEGEREHVMALAQTMFRSLSDYVEQICPGRTDGLHTEASVDNIRWLQVRAGMEPTGIMDRFTWNMLVRLYEVFVLRPRELEERTKRTAKTTELFDKKI